MLQRPTLSEHSDTFNLIDLKGTYCQILFAPKHLPRKDALTILSFLLLSLIKVSDMNTLVDS